MSAIILNGLKACDTCRKAMKSMRDAGLEVSLRDLRETPPTTEEIRNWADAVGPALLNTRSTTWRGLDEAARANDSVELMQAHPALIKRPVIETGGKVYLGWTPATREALGLS